MKTLKIFSLIAAVGFLASCSSNRDLVSLDEYDDLYYQGNERAATQKPAPSEFYADEGAGSAESAYYGNDGYNEGPADAEPIEDSVADKQGDDEYYDPDYARRIDNFHRSEEPEYIYNRAYNTSPSLRFNMGYSSFGSYGGMGFGFSYGNYSPYGFGYSPFYSPYYMDPWRYRFSYGYSPFYYRSPFFDPWAPYGYYSPYAMYNPYRYGGGYGYPYYGGGYPPYYGGGTDSYQSNTEYGRRDNSSRNSRGGVVRSGERGGIQDGSGIDQSRDSRTIDTRERPARTRENVTEGSDYYNRSERDRVLRDQENTRVPRTREDVRRPRQDVSQPRRSEPLTSPYTRQRTRTYDAPDYSRSRTTPTRSQPSRPRTAPTPRTAPSRNYSTPPSNNQRQRSAPSTSPTPSRNSGSSGSSSPSRPSRSRR